MSAGNRRRILARPVRRQPVGDVSEAVLAGQVPGSLTEDVARVHGGSAGHQRLHDVQAPHEGGVVERRPSVTIGVVHRELPREQFTDDGHRPAGCGIVQQRAATFGPGRQIDAVARHRREEPVEALLRSGLQQALRSRHRWPARSRHVWRSRSTRSRNPRHAASVSGVSPNLSFASTLAFRSSSRRAMSALPDSLATSSSGVRP